MTESKYKLPNTLWELIKFKLELQIINGTYGSADKVPSMAELSIKYGIGKSTAKKVLESLYVEGIITKKRGIGYFVKPLVKNKLKDKHYKIFSGGISEYISMAREMNISENELRKVLNEIIEDVYTHRE